MFHVLFLRLIFCFLLFASSTLFSSEENFILMNGLKNEIIFETGSHIDERISPCSSFKIILSLMGYDAGILKDEVTPTWNFQDGYDDYIESWKVPLNPRNWMKHSCLWYSKIIALELGSEKIENYLDLMEYGNKDMSGGFHPPGPLGVAWICSSLKISPREQADFIQKMISGKLPISIKAVEMTKALVYKEEFKDGWKLFGKTGWSGHDICKDGITLEHGWFVGWIEKDGLFYPFAYLIKDKKINLQQRIPRVKQLLEEYLKLQSIELKRDVKLIPKQI